MINFNRLNKILIIRLSSLGDIILTTPLIRSIKKKYPHIIIDYLTKLEYKEVLIQNRNLNEIIFYPKENEKRNLEYLISSIQKDYDLIIDLQNNLRSRQITRNFKTKVVRFKKYSFRKFLLVWTKINLLKNFPPIPERYAKTINITLDDEGVELYSNIQPNTKIVNLKNLIGICPGGKHFTKRYPLEYQIQLCRLLLDNNYNVVLFGGEIDKEICQQIESSLPNVINLQNEDNLLQTISDMNLCDTIICNDSGLMHLASSLNKKLIVIFGSTVKEFGFMPYKSEDAIILENNQIKCRPCSHIGRNNCPKGHFNCMKFILPEKIFQIINKIN